MKKIILILISLAILAITIFLISKSNITGEAIKDHSYTKAICNGTNYCQDYEITCGKQNLTAIKPILNATAQHLEDWEDPRKNQNNKELC